MLKALNAIFGSTLVRSSYHGFLGWSVLALCFIGAPSLASARAQHGDTHAESEHGASDHGGHQGINWFYGFVGESEEDEPSLLWRSPGMPVPLFAYLINSAILFTILFKVGRKPIVEGLAKRREQIMRGMEEAAAMRSEAVEQLKAYETKLASVDAEITRIRKDMREAADAERAAILAEAKKRHERMERDAKRMIEQELKNAREELLEQTVRKAMESATTLVAQSASDADHERLCEEYLNSVQTKLPGVAGGHS
jgi:F0F1-type ATP synthase membrane subunit b/b'